MAPNLDRKRHYHTLEEYFALEKVGDARYEYWDGEIFCMSGGSKEHYRLASNVHALLRRAIEKKTVKRSPKVRPLKRRSYRRIVILTPALFVAKVGLRRIMALMRS